jgi:hypothetical protein
MVDRAGFLWVSRGGDLRAFGNNGRKSWHKYGKCRIPSNVMDELFQYEISLMFSNIGDGTL